MELNFLDKNKAPGDFPQGIVKPQKPQQWKQQQQKSKKLLYEHLKIILPRLKGFRGTK